MKLYTYSDEQIAFVDAKWIVMKVVLFGIFIGCVIFFTFFTLNHSAGGVFRSDLANSFEIENYILQAHVNLLSPQIYSLKMQTNYLIARSNRLDKLLFCTPLAGTMDSSVTITAKIFRFQSSLFASTGSHP